MIGSSVGLQANRDAEAAGDWKPLADFYADDATYGWNIGPKEDVMCVGKDEIRDVALGLEMQGLENWVYEYQKVLVDEKQGEIVGFWKQIVNKSDGTQDEIYGIGGSWFRLNVESADRVAARLLRLRARRLHVRANSSSPAICPRACRSASNGPWPVRRCPATTHSARHRFRSGDARPSGCLGAGVTHLTNGSSLASLALVEGTCG